MFCSDCPHFKASAKNQEAGYIALQTGELAHCDIPKGEIIYLARQQERLGTYCIKEGVVLLGTGKKSSEIIPTRFAHSGDIIGCESIINNYFNQTAISLTSIKACFIAKDLFLNDKGLLKIEFRQQIIKQMLSEIEGAEHNLSETKNHSLTERLYSLLLSLSKGNTELPLLLSQNDLANWLGCSTRSIARSVEFLVSNGYLKLNGTHKIVAVIQKEFFSEFEEAYVKKDIL